MPQRSVDARHEPSAGGRLPADTQPPTDTQPPSEAPAAVPEAPPPRFECGTAACPGTTFSLRRYLLNTPQVFNLNFVFTPEDTKSSRRLGELLNRIGDPVDVRFVASALWSSPPCLTALHRCSWKLCSMSAAQRLLLTSASRTTALGAVLQPQSARGSTGCAALCATVTAITCRFTSIPSIVAGSSTTTPT